MLHTNDERLRILRKLRNYTFEFLEVVTFYHITKAVGVYAIKEKKTRTYAL